MRLGGIILRMFRLPHKTVSDLFAHILLIQNVDTSTALT